MLNPSNLDIPSKDQLKRLQDRLSDFKESNEQQYLDEFLKVHELILFLPSLRETQPQLVEFLTNDFMPSLAKALIMARSFKNKEALEISNRLLEAMVMFGNMTLEEDNAKTLEMLKFVLDSSRTYYKLNDQEENTLFSVILQKNKKYIKILGGFWRCLVGFFKGILGGVGREKIKFLHGIHDILAQPYEFGLIFRCLIDSFKK